MLQQWLKELHRPLIISMAALTFVGILFIHSASYMDGGHYASKQLFWVGAGVIVFFLIPLFGYRSFLGISYLVYVLTLLLLLWVLIGGETRLGAQRWISIGPLALQPSEFAKLATVMALAHFLGTNHQWEREGKTLLKALGMMLLPFLLIVRQPDLGSALLFIPMITVLLFVWGLRYRYIIVAAIAGLVSAPLMWQFLKVYQRKRLLVFLNPQLDPLGAGYTALQSRIAVGAGGFAGKGYMAGTQSQLNFVPEHHTDFIFCVLAEEWGFLGSLLLIVLYGFLFRAIFQIIMGTTDTRARLLAAGIIALLFSQVFVNIGMSIGLMPITGLTLPLVSYGGSSFLATCIALGLVLSIHKERSIF